MSSSPAYIYERSYLLKRLTLDSTIALAAAGLATSDGPDWFWWPVSEQWFWWSWVALSGLMAVLAVLLLVASLFVDIREPA